MTPRMWQIVRSVVSALFITAIVWAGVADWPHCDVWQIVLCGNAYWLWEMAILFVGWGLVLHWMLYAQRKLEGGVCPLCGR